MLCKQANFFTKRILLVIRQIQDGFSTSRNKTSSLVFKFSVGRITRQLPRLGSFVASPSPSLEASEDEDAADGIDDDDDDDDDEDEDANSSSDDKMMTSQ